MNNMKREINDSFQQQMNSNQDYEYHKKNNKNLLGYIITDLFEFQKTALFLLLLIIISAAAILITTYQIRKQLYERERLILEQDVLASEWRNLIIEENVLADPKRIEYKAKNQLGMTFVKPENETVIVIKSR